MASIIWHARLAPAGHRLSLRCTISIGQEQGARSAIPPLASAVCAVLGISDAYTAIGIERAIWNQEQTETNFPE